MDKYECNICGYVYDPAAGDPDNGVAPGTKFEDVAEERSGKMRFVKVNTEAEPELSARFRIRSIPTIMIFKNGEVIDMLNGAVPKAPFESWLNESL